MGFFKGVSYPKGTVILTPKVTGKLPTLILAPKPPPHFSATARVTKKAKRK